MLLKTYIIIKYFSFKQIFCLLILIIFYLDSIKNINLDSRLQVNRIIKQGFIIITIIYQNSYYIIIQNNNNNNNNNL